MWPRARAANAERDGEPLLSPMYIPRRSLSMHCSQHAFAGDDQSTGNFV